MASDTHPRSNAIVSSTQNDSEVILVNKQHCLHVWTVDTELHLVVIGHVILAANTGTTILVPYIDIK